jgi:hypothetical protein
VRHRSPGAAGHDRVECFPLAAASLRAPGDFCGYVQLRGACAHGAQDVAEDAVGNARRRADGRNLLRVFHQRERLEQISRRAKARSREKPPECRVVRDGQRIVFKARNATPPESSRGGGLLDESPPGDTPAEALHLPGALRAVARVGHEQCPAPGHEGHAVRTAEPSQVPYARSGRDQEGVKRFRPHTGAQGSQAGLGCSDAFDHGAQSVQTLVHLVLQQREEQFFFALEVRVESAARVACRRSDLFDARRFKAVSSENPARGFEQRLASCVGSQLMFCGVRLL